MKDISIRLALGGTPKNVLQLVVGRGMALVAWGILCGIGMAFVLARMLSSLLFGVGAADPLTFTGVTAVMAGAALAACAVPAARAASVEPAVVLRND
jgi:putative ABC transport system permease protein